MADLDDELEQLLDGRIPGGVGELVFRAVTPEGEEQWDAGTFGQDVHSVVVAHLAASDTAVDGKSTACARLTMNAALERLALRPPAYRETVVRAAVAELGERALFAAREPEMVLAAMCRLILESRRRCYVEDPESGVVADG